MGWLFPLIFVTLALLALWRFGKLPSVALQVTAIMLMITVIGYAWQGSPNLPSIRATPLADMQSIDTSGALIHPLKPAFTREDMALNTAEALLRAHNSVGAVSLLKDELRGAPHSAALWNGLGKALAAHNGGAPSPASDYAFKQAVGLREPGVKDITP